MGHGVRGVHEPVDSGEANQLVQCRLGVIICGTTPHLGKGWSVVRRHGITASETAGNIHGCFVRGGLQSLRSFCRKAGCKHWDLGFEAAKMQVEKAACGGPRESLNNRDLCCRIIIWTFQTKKMSKMPIFQICLAKYNDRFPIN